MGQFKNVLPEHQSKRLTFSQLHSSFLAPTKLCKHIWILLAKPTVLFIQGNTHDDVLLVATSLLRVVVKAVIMMDRSLAVVVSSNTGSFSNSLG